MAGLIPEKSGESYAIQCFPLYSLLLAIGKGRLPFATLKKLLLIYHHHILLQGSEQKRERRGTASRVKVGKLS